MKIKTIVQAATLTMTLVCAAAQAAPVMPSFDGAPTGWSTDRYAPASFSDVGTYQGRGDVLGIGISSADSRTNRPSAFQTQFYNTQGMKQAIAGAGAGSVLAADLYVPEAWRNGAAGNVRTDMWGVMSDAVNDVQAYTIIGFTNYGGAARLRVYDDAVGPDGWVDIMTVSNFNSWMSLSIDFTGSSFVYSIDGTAIYTDTTINNATHFSSVIMQAYNFDETQMAGAKEADYTAHWSNTPAAAVPEPTEMALLGIGLLGLAATRRRAKKSA